MAAESQRAKFPHDRLMFASFPGYRFHSLRHSYALTTYVSRRMQGDPNPGKYVQSVLGHTSQDTTDRLYLRASHILEAQISEDIQEQMMGLVR